MKIAFIGHRRIVHADIEQKLHTLVAREIEKGCQFFTMGTHGEFDKLALKVCRSLRKKYIDIHIEVVLTSLHSLVATDNYHPYADVQTVLYALENVHYKQRITVSNRYMLDSCTAVISYASAEDMAWLEEVTCGEIHHRGQIHTNKSGTRTALLYAKKRGLPIFNLLDR